MPSLDSAPYNGDYKLWGKETRAYFRYGWQEIRRNREPQGVVQAQPDLDLKPDDSRSPYRVYADTVMAQHINTLKDPLTVIDMGCGTGKYARYFKAHLGAYHGVDAFPSKDWEALQREAQGWELSVEFHHIMGEKVGELPIAATFSLSSSSLEHVDDPDAVIRGLATCSQAGALGLHIVPAPWSLLTYGKHGWRRFSAERLKTMFESAGFEILSIYRLGGLPSQFLHLVWVTGLEEGLWLQHLTFAQLPFFLYRVASIFRYQRMRTHPLLGAIYRSLLKVALRLDRYAPFCPVGYAILVQRKVN